MTECWTVTVAEGLHYYDNMEENSGEAEWGGKAGEVEGRISIPKKLQHGT